MGFCKKLARDVASDVRARGRQYHASGVVRIVRGDTRSVRAIVEGTERYRVILERHRKGLQVCCSCPYYQDRLVPCKHVWATILAAEQEGYLQGAGDPGPFFIDSNTDDRLMDWVEGADDEDDRPADAFGPNGWTADEPQRRFRPEGSPNRPGTRINGPARHPGWKQALAGLEEEAPPGLRPTVEAWPPGREILYVVDGATTREGRGLFIEVAQRQRKKDGTWSRPKVQRIPQAQINLLPDTADREILSYLGGAREESASWPSYNLYYYDSAPTRYRLPTPIQDALLARMCRTGRCLLRQSAEDVAPRRLAWESDDPWDFWLRVTRNEHTQQYVVLGELRRGEERHTLAEPVLLVAGGLVFWSDAAARLQDFGAFEWISLLRQQGALTVPFAEKDKLLGELLRLPHLPRLDLPEELHFEEVAVKPHPRLVVQPPRQPAGFGQPRLRGELSFDYDGEVVASDQPTRGIYQPARRRLLLRDPAAEMEAAEQLAQLGFRPPQYGQVGGLEILPRHLPKIVRTLLEAGWHVEAEGKVYRRPGAIQIEVKSGIDWFDLDGRVDFGGRSAHLPDLLAALRRGENLVALDDGTFGMLPEEWLAKYGALAALGTAEGEHLRFRRSQAGLLDALVSAQPEATCDEVFRRVRDELHAFAGVEASDPPETFTGRLRGYQREGLGWLGFLHQFGFGGCLADDMGLGKTVQVLALLESRRLLRAGPLTPNPSPQRGEGSKRPPPSLVVVPKSLIFNWKQEAARFTPNLRVCDHTGSGRQLPGEHFHQYDIVLTTYGTLRRDVRHLKDFTFDYCILDEAQAIKNANSESAKAARLLKADHRLALSGTPVENHLGELWSLFEFLNPGMLGSAAVFQSAGGRNPDECTRGLLARALRPFILRRTKEQVAKDLPAKLEQTIHCEMEPAQRELYDELRAHYRDSLLSRIDRDGIQRSRMHILEALLRLRQAACHPGLIDKERVAEPSAKLDALLAQVEEVLDEGHKVLVFSQFTKLLAIVRERLDREQVPYEYLDGRTRDRQARVEHFQDDPECKLFLISLKAGGLGLNLTAAEYVFLLDPWWNPAVEAQAIDRAHRIGQTKPVFAYRLIARDTVEEKIVELQKTKRALADAIVNADNSLIRNLGREDLELLLS
jgi:superfamily II DNA or RNA helicase